jgi:hypothetical protein
MLTAVQGGGTALSMRLGLSLTDGPFPPGNAMRSAPRRVARGFSASRAAPHHDAAGLGLRGTVTRPCRRHPKRRPSRQALRWAS